MTSKEALKNICSECEMLASRELKRCPFRSISNEYCDDYEQIKKDLEVLEILKNPYYEEETENEAICCKAYFDEENQEVRWYCYYYEWDGNYKSEYNKILKKSIKSKNMKLCFHTSSATKPLTIKEVKEILKIVEEKSD